MMTTIEENGLIFHIENDQLITIIEKTKNLPIPTLFIPNKIGECNIRVIGPFALSCDCEFLNIEIANGITLSDCSFAALNSITSITLPSDLKEIPELCFAFCRNLQKISGAEMVTEIHENAFFNTPINIKNLKESLFYSLWID